MITDIKFDCTNCGQKMVVEAAAAGLGTECPSCRASIVIPKTASLHDRSYEPEPARAGRRPVVHAHAKDRGSEGFINPDIVLRDELLEASRQISRLEAQVTAGTAAAEIAGTEMEKAKTERRKLRDELVQIKKELASREKALTAAQQARDAAETRALTLAGELNRTESELTAQQEEASRWHQEAEKFQTGATDLQARLERAEQQVATGAEALRAAEIARQELQEQLARVQNEGATAQRAVQTLEGQVRDLSARLAAAEASGAEAAEKWQAATGELAETRKRLADSEESGKSLAICLEELTKDRDALQRSLSQNTTGQDLVETRTQLQTAEKERERLLDRTKHLAHELETTSESRRRLEEQVKSVNRDLEEARRRAETTSEVRLRQDNEVLRGIIARQNSELEQKHVQLVRLKRARFGVRLAYAAFALGMLAIALWAMKTVPGLQAGKFF